MSEQAHSFAEAGVPPIETDRLLLLPMTPVFLDASLSDAHATAEQLLGVSIPDQWWQERALMEIRRDDIRRNAALQPWTLRAIVLRHQPLMVGHIGFHTMPNPDYLRELAPGGIEFGYTVFPEFRRHGYAYEAGAALMNWAQHTHGIKRFIVSISPANVPSLRLADKLGFQYIGSHFDPEDGQEDIFERWVTE